ncbi:hypothetical protein Afil01_44430 [Actinorhabdospora filicis]|uniref:Gfo/Idh/MocA family oxidoreductase n=1 Tax=Actinorhabdospora filicis TaxID=1785913 RepID=A0A9W6SP90_9ACTN|nr:Gfo/Idh/MocA family oxidoreductase [Actinorhabdospora filicis]GLZ79636.1 hypothetical protein Afil01_44430 [Actinorhabdospora filicis]
MAEEKVRLGIIGLGAMGTDMIEAASGHRDVKVTVAADVSPETVARHAHRAGIEFSTVPADVLESDVDAVYIATPPVFHPELVLAAAAKGMGVFCEKPLAVDLADSRAMLDAVEKAGVAAAVNFALSDRWAVLEVERALRSGELGEPAGVEIRLRFPEWPRAFQRHAAWLDGREQGGFVREVFSHFAYLTDRLLGPLEPVSVGLDYADGGRAEKAAHGLWRAGGVPVQLTGLAGVAAEETYEWYLWGTRRSYLLRDWARLYVSDGGDWEPVPAPERRGNDATRLALFARAVRGERVADLADFAAAYRVQEVVEAFHR